MENRAKWDQSAKQLSIRSRRSPQQSVLYRVVYELHEELECCGHTELIAFSCKQRFCPSCDAKRAHLFAENLVENILGDAPVSQVVLTIPKRLRAYFKYDRQLLDILYTAAWQAWKEAVNDQLPDMDTGAVAALHSAGNLL